VVHRVKRGDTATGLAVRYHAWTRELRSLNGLGRHSRLYVGQRIRIPVVVAAARRAQKSRTPKPATRTSPKKTRASSRPWKHADASRAKVRPVIVKAAKRHGVNPRLALAISWQEAGWQQRRISSAGAIGAMQVMPGTGRWISSSYVGRPLNLHGLRDNVTAGVVLISVLQDMTSGAHVIGGYYQGLGSIRARGMYPSTQAYVRNVRALRSQLRAGWDPA
jgi:murein DD-endopeptidase MepM/ murein hydrolase activator NlpD